MVFDTAANKAAGNGRAQQQMIDAQTGIASKRIAETLPERVNSLG
jgi:hypothetical protein